MIITAKEILNILPHKWPFIYIDKVLDIEPGKSAVGIKNVTINEPYFEGHFPGQPILPGVLIIESLAQLTAVMYCAEYLPESFGEEQGSTVNDAVLDIDISSKVGYLVNINNFKFKKTVHPGDTMELRAIKKAKLGTMTSVQVSAFVNGECIAEGSIGVSQKN